MADLEWAKINDFKPGIYHTVSPNHPPGTAQEDKTFRCYASSDGSLIPLPGLVQTIVSEVQFAEPEDPMDPDPSLVSEQYRITGLMVNNPVYHEPEAYTGVFQNNSEIWIGVEWWDDDGGGRLNMQVQRYLRNYATNPAWEIAGTRSYSQTYDSRVRPRKTEFVTMRSNPSDTNVAGAVVVCWVMSGWAQSFPDTATPTVSSTLNMPGDNIDDPAASLVGVDGLVSHQGRAVIFPLLVLGMGTDQVYTTNEAFFWTLVNDVSSLDSSIALGGYFNAIGSYDNPTGYQVYQSLTADELLLIKGKGGAIVISGNLNDHQITTKPNVRGTGHSMNRGTVSPRGFVYPTDGGGVWLWEGGDISTPLTPHLDDDFWRPPAVAPAQPVSPAVQEDTEWGHFVTQCCDWNQFVMMPNNWLWDSDENGWWKIDDGADYVIHRWASDWRGLLCYGTPSGYSTNTDGVVYEFNKVVPAETYSWQSHPLSDTIDREIELREVILVASGTGTVRITTRTAQDQVGQTVEFDVSATFSPNVTSHSVSVKGSHLTLEIESIGTEDGDGNFVAPTVHEVRYGVLKSTMVPRDSSPAATY